MNKGKLLASTVLVSAAAVMAASGAVAKVKISGTTEHWIGKGKEAAAQSEIDLKADAEMHFSFSKKLNNGMKLTGKFEKEANATATGYDEASITISGGFGKLIVGNNDGKRQEMFVEKSYYFRPENPENQHLPPNRLP